MRPKNVTAKLLGDPAPDRVVPDTPRAAVFSRRRWDEPVLHSPIHLTFRAMRAAQGEEN